MSLAGNQAFASIDEVWGPGAQLGTAAATYNMYQNPEYQRQILNASTSFGIVPRDAQPIEPAAVKQYLAELYKDSGPGALDALLPPDFVKTVRAREQRRVTFVAPSHSPEQEQSGGLFNLSADDETLFYAFFALFGLMLLSDGFSETF